MDAQEELAFLRSVAASQLQTIKALTLGCEKYGLTETTPIVRHLAAQDDEIERLRAELSASREDAERYRHLLREAYVFGRTTPDVHNLPNEPVSLWLHSTVPLDVEGINGIVDAARKGEETQ